MSLPNRNTVWARAFAEELAGAGVREVCVAPGSRSTPLVLALHRQESVEAYTHLDERCAAFFALGIGKATGRPAAVVTTSGTAVANLLPAAVEAHQSEAPLLLLTADRPPTVRGTDANQSVDQAGAFRRYVRMSLDVSPPRMDEPGLRYVRSVAVRAAAAAGGSPPGPVHLNFPFEKPLEPTPVPGDVPAEWEENPPAGAPGRSGSRDRARAPAADATAPGRQLGDLARRLREARRPLLVCGPVPAPGEAGAAARQLARADRIPLLADPLSGARFGPGATEVAVPAYDLLLGSPRAREALAPDLVIRAGASPTSRNLLGFLESYAGCDQVVIDAGALWKDHLATATEYLRADPARTLRELEARAEGGRDPAWGRRWLRAGRRAREAALRAVKGTPFEGEVLGRAAAAVPDGANLVVGSSMPVRDLDAYAAPREVDLRVLGNRGASGIDGAVSLAFGAAAATGAPTLCALGDLSFFHDMNGLLAARRHDLAVTFLLVNNDGGGIFHFLPIREHDPPFTELFATPHGLDFRKASELYGLPHLRVADGEEAAEALASEGWDEPRVVEVVTDRERNRELHDAAEEAAREALRDIG